LRHSRATDLRRLYGIEAAQTVLGHAELEVTQVYAERDAEAALAINSAEWKRYDFALTPDGADDAGRLAVTLGAPGSVVVGYAFLQPGPWGRFQGLPVRKDVAEGLIAHGVTVMRMGGLMVNTPGYRWKAMTNPRDRREPYAGYWYPHSSGG